MTRPRPDPPLSAASTSAGSRPGLSPRARLIALGGVCIAVLGIAVGYVVNSHEDQRDAIHAAKPVPLTPLAAVQKVPHIVFRNTALGPKYGMVAEVALSNPAGPRAITSTECDRVYATSASVLCLSSSTGVVTSYAARVLNSRSLRATAELPLTGIPSRARLSRDGTLAATTSFISGDSYAGTTFSTRTDISRVGAQSLGGLEDFSLIHDGRRITPVDRNYWGVTFGADDNTFFATVQWSKHTWLVRGSISRRTVVTLHEDAECPSLSPDGTRIVFKQRGGLPIGHWRLVMYDIATGRVTPLAETRSVDDQVEWLDNSTVIYGLPRPGSGAAIDDVWKVPADGTGAPSVLIPQAWSPAVVN